MANKLFQIRVMCNFWSQLLENYLQQYEFHAESTYPSPHPVPSHSTPLPFPHLIPDTCPTNLTILFNNERYSKYTFKDYFTSIWSHFFFFLLTFACEG